MEFRGKGSLKTIEAEIVDGVFPPYPGIGKIKPVIIPPPPKIKENLTDKEIADFIGAAYRGAVKEVYKKNCYSFIRGDVTKSKHYKIIVVAGKILREYGVPPIVWAVWSAKKWVGWKGKKINPPVNWLFAFNRIEQYMSMFRNEMHIPSTPTIFLTPTHKRLLKLYDAMLLDLGNAQRDLYADILRTHFPGDLYSQLVAKCENEIKTVQFGLHHRIQRGEWIWKI